MEVDKNSFLLTKWQPIEILLALLFLVSPFYFQPSLGGKGLELPFNFGVWAVVSVVIFCALLTVIKSKKLYLPKHYAAIIAFPILIMLSGILAGVISPIEWFFRQVYIITGVLFLLSLFQYEKNLNINRILFLIIVSTFLQSIVAVLQINQSSFMSGWYFQSLSVVPRGVFQQVNVLATYLVSGILIAFYVQGKDYIIHSSVYLRSTLIAVIGFNSYVVIATGSRIGLLSLGLGLLMMFFFQRKNFRKNYLFIVLSLCALFIGGYIAKDGLDTTTDKSASLVDQQYADARMSIYAISLEAVNQSPIYGHGIGGFLKAWNEQAGSFHQQHKNAAMPDYIKHPHNEILFWSIEGGLISVVGILSALMAIGIAIYRQGVEQGGAYLALILPIGLHTQVELPFYISSLHWFLWLFLIYMILTNSTISKTVSLSRAVTRLIKASAVALLLMSNYMLINTARAQLDIYRFVKQQGEPPYLQIALSNLYTLPYAEQLAMRSKLYSSIEKRNFQQIHNYLTWAEKYILLRPELKMYEDSINAYIALDDEENKCRVINEAHKSYPINEVIQQLRGECLKK